MINQNVKKKRSTAASGSTGRKKAKTAHRRKLKLSIKRADLFTALWLVLFFPLGLTRMWSDKCRWNIGMKYAISGLCVAAVVGILIVPSPYKHVPGGVEIVAEDPEVEIYGPSAPKMILSGYSSTAQESVVAEATSEGETAITVYAADGAKCYHLGDCKFAFASAKRLSVYEAYFLGYKACGACNPPIYDPATGKTVDTSEEALEASAGTTESVLTDVNEVSEDIDDGKSDNEV